MLLRAVAPFLMLAVAAFAGCLGAEPGDDDGDVLDDVATNLVPAETPLWDVRQYVPHPAYNFPTLTNPPTGPNVPEWWVPINATPLPTPIAGLEHLAKSPDDVRRGGGMAVFGGLAVVPGYGNPTSVLDIRDPASPKLLSTIDEDNHRNVDFIAYPDGRLVAIFATGRDGLLPYWDITDPAAPVRLGALEPTTGTHKVNVVPGTPIVYNANSDGGGTGPAGAVPVGHVPGQGTGLTEIFDLSDPWNPVHVQDWRNGYGCHHIYFWNDPAQEKYRAICAGIEVTQIWDTADPKNPANVVTIPVHHGVAGSPSASVFLMAFSHFSILNDDGTVLIVGDEMGGGGVPPGCGVGASAAGRSPSTPAGALWFYDVSDEKNPRLRGWFSPGAPYASNPPPVSPNPANPVGSVVNSAFFSCTAHHGRLVPDESRDLLAMAFYYAGVVLVDFTDPASPRMVSQFNQGTDTWEVQYYNGYLFTGDLRRGMDVLKFK